MVYNEIIRVLREKGVSFTVHEHGPVMTMQDVEEKLPFPKEKLLKTLVFKIRNSFWILAVIKGQDKVDYRKLASAFGVNRESLVRPSAEEVQSQLGFQIGGICPIPMNDSIKAVINNDILDMDVVYCGIGRNDRSLEIKLQDLLYVSNARVYSIAQEKEH